MPQITIYAPGQVIGLTGHEIRAQSGQERMVASKRDHCFPFCFLQKVLRAPKVLDTGSVANEAGG
jgi:hypothetical protein